VATLHVKGNAGQSDPIILRGCRRSTRGFTGISNAKIATHGPAELPERRCDFPIEKALQFLAVGWSDRRRSWLLAAFDLAICFC
jgi:hypothetical protein